MITNLLLILLLTLWPIVGFSQVNVSRDELPNTNSTDSTAVLNNVLRQNQNAINSIGGYFNSNGYLLPPNGGTGTNISSFANGSVLIYDSGNVGIGTFGQGTSGQFLESQGPSVKPIWAVPVDTNTSNVVFAWNGQTDSAGSGSGIITGTTLVDAGSTNGSYLYLKSRDASGSGKTAIFLRTKFKKISSISNLTIYGYAWEDSAAASSVVSVELNVNGSTIDTSTTNSTAPAWVNSSSLDVSALTNNTVYDMTIAVKTTNAGAAIQNAYLASVIVFGS